MQTQSRKISHETSLSRARSLHHFLFNHSQRPRSVVNWKEKFHASYFLSSIVFSSLDFSSAFLSAVHIRLMMAKMELISVSWRFLQLLPSILFPKSKHLVSHFRLPSVSEAGKAAAAKVRGTYHISRRKLLNDPPNNIDDKNHLSRTSTSLFAHSQLEAFSFPPLHKYIVQCRFWSLLRGLSHFCCLFETGHTLPYIPPLALTHKAIASRIPFSSKCERRWFWVLKWQRLSRRCWQRSDDVDLGFEPSLTDSSANQYTLGVSCISIRRVPSGSCSQYLDNFRCPSFLHIYRYQWTL